MTGCGVDDCLNPSRASFLVAGTSLMDLEYLRCSLIGG